MNKIVLPQKENKQTFDLNYLDGENLIWAKYLDSRNEIRILGIIEERLQRKIPLLDSQVKWNDFGVFLHNKAITGFGFYSQQLNALPNEIWALKNLEVLNFVNCGLNELSTKIGSLISLKELYIGGNQLTVIPKSIEKLNNLQILYILEDNLFSIPEVIGNLRNLNELVLSSKFVKKLPHSIIQLTSNTCSVYLNNQEVMIPDSTDKKRNH